jgi:trimeric autotransporter adhesin
MKTKLFFSILFVLSSLVLSSQTPQGFNYQAIAWDATGKAIANTTIQVRMTIQSDSIAGSTYWIELFSAVPTNSFGMFTLTIGKGTKQTGSLVSAFSDIDWRVTPKWIKTEVNYNGWKTMGSARLMTVPYSMVSSTLSGPVKKLTVSGTNTSPDSAIFEVKNNTGQTVFAVYPEGVRAYVDNGIAKGTKGGFAIGGFGTDKAPSKNFFIVNADSIRAYIAPSTAKGVKGGFAIGGFDAAKGATGEQYMRVTRDSTRVYVGKPAKGTKGGFAIGGFDEVKGTTDNFMQLTPQNYFIGHNSGKNITTGLYNSFLGYMSGYKNSSGSSNTFFGDSTGSNNTTGSWNVFLGKQAGYTNETSVSNVYIGNEAGKMAKHTALSNASYNVAVGTLAGYNNNGIGNVFLGQQAGQANTTGKWNVFVGPLAGGLNDTANYNVFMGSYAGYHNMGNYNVFLGEEAGRYNKKGKQNIFVGTYAGYYNDTASYNVAIGTEAGFNNMGKANIFMGNFAGYENVGANYNIFIGSNAGTSTTSGEKNVILGSDAGYDNTTGAYNTFIGNLAGSSNISGSYNVYMGNNAGMSATGSNNTVIGNAAGKLVTADNNSMFGFQAGYRSTTGEENAFFGYQSGHENSSGSYNTNIGRNAGYSNSTGIGNTILGNGANYYNTNGSFNTVIGNAAGYNNITGSNNVFVGKWAGYWETGSDKLYIDNSSNSSTGALIYGDFSSPHQLRFNAYVGINSTPDSYYRLYISGAAYATGSFWGPSDIRLKQNIRSMEGDGVIGKVMDMQVIKYNYTNEITKGDTLLDREYIGVVAQDIEKSFPQAVRTDENGYKAVSLNALTAILFQAVKDQQKEIDELKALVNQLLQSKGK